MLWRHPPESIHVDCLHLDRHERLWLGTSRPATVGWIDTARPLYEDLSTCTLLDYQPEPVDLD
jgi:hypothetical protein